MTAEWYDWADESQAKVGDWALTVLSVADLEVVGGRSWLAAAAYFGLMYHQTEHPTREEAKAAAERAMAIPPVVPCHRCGAGADGCCLGPKPAEPCWGKVEVVDDEGEPGDPLWVHACEGHAEAYHGGAYRRADGNTRLADYRSIGYTSTGTPCASSTQRELPGPCSTQPSSGTQAPSSGTGSPARRSTGGAFASGKTRYCDIK